MTNPKKRHNLKVEKIGFINLTKNENETKEQKKDFVHIKSEEKPNQSTNKSVPDNFQEVEFNFKNKDSEKSEQFPTPVNNQEIINTSTKVKKTNLSKYKVPRFLKKFLRIDRLRDKNQTKSLTPYMFKKNQTDYANSFFADIEKDITQPTNPVKFTAKNQHHNYSGQKGGSFNNYFQNEFTKKNSTLPVVLSIILTIIFGTLVYFSLHLTQFQWYYTLILSIIFASTFAVLNLVSKTRKILFSLLTVLFLTGLGFYLFKGHLDFFNGGLLVLSIIFLYQSYRETTKNILASRLVFVNNLTKNAHSLILSAVIFVLCAGFYTNIMKKGAADFISKDVLSHPKVQNTLTTTNPNLGTKIAQNLNVVTLQQFNKEYTDAYSKPNEELKKPTARELILWLNFDAKAENVLTPSERKEIESAKRFDTPEVVLNAKNTAINEKLGKFFTTNYASTNLNLASEIDEKNYLTIFNKYVVNRVQNFQNGQNNITKDIPYLNKISSAFFIALFLSSLLGLALFFAKLIYKFITGLITFFTGQTLRSIIWQILIWTKLVKVEIEPVESEIIKL